MKLAQCSKFTSLLLVHNTKNILLKEQTKVHHARAAEKDEFVRKEHEDRLIFDCAVELVKCIVN